MSTFNAEEHRFNLAEAHLRQQRTHEENRKILDAVNPFKRQKSEVNFSTQMKNFFTALDIGYQSGHVKDGKFSVKTFGELNFLFQKRLNAEGSLLLTPRLTDPTMTLVCSDANISSNQRFTSTKLYRIKTNSPDINSHIVFVFEEERDLMQRIAKTEGLGGEIMSVQQINSVVKHFPSLWAQDSDDMPFRAIFFRNTMKLVVLYPSEILERI